jgi:integrase
MDKMDIFLNSLKNKKTRIVYKANLKMFFDTIKKTPETLLNQEQKTTEEDIQIFLGEIKNKAPKTVLNKISTIRSFIEYNRIELPHIFWKTLKNKIGSNRPITVKIIPTNEELKQILIRTNCKSRAMILILSSSGIRIGELLKLKEEYINFESEPTLIEIPAKISKYNIARTTFISNEATYSLKEWLKERNDYIEQANKKHYKKARKIENYVFPFSYETARAIWVNVISNTKLNNKDHTTHRYKMRIHSLRAYFRTRATLKAPLDLVEEMMGHSGYLTQEYRQHTTEDLKQAYIKAEQDLSIFDKSTDTEQLEENIDKLKTKNKELEERLKQIEKNLYERIHPNIEAPQSYYEIKEIILLPDSERFIDIDKNDYQEYRIEDQERIKELKKYYEHDIKEARKYKLKKITFK